MSYATEETLPMLDGVNNSKKQSFGLAALMVLCLALTSFMAGHAYSSAATTSAIKASSGYQWSGDFYDTMIWGGDCRLFQQDLLVACYDQKDCLMDAWYRYEGDVQSCVELSDSPSCEVIFGMRGRCDDHSSDDEYS